MYSKIDQKILEKLELMSVILHKSKKIGDEVISYITDTMLYFVPKTISREKVLEYLGSRLRKIAYYSPQISFLLCHLHFCHIIANEYKLGYDSPIVMPIILDATYHRSGIVTTSRDISQKIVIRGTKITPYYDVCMSALIFTKHNKDYAIVLISKDGLPEQVYNMQLSSLACELSWLVFHNYKIRPRMLIPLRRKNIIELLSIFVDLLRYHILGIMNRLYEEVLLWTGNNQHLILQQTLGKVDFSRGNSIEKIGYLVALLIRSFCLDTINPSSIINLYLGALIESLSYAYALSKIRNNIKKL